MNLGHPGCKEDIMEPFIKADKIIIQELGPLHAIVYGEVRSRFGYFKGPFFWKMSDIQSDLNIGYKPLRNVLKELEDAGYLKIGRTFNNKPKFYLLDRTTSSDMAEPLLPKGQNPYNNNKVNNNKVNKNINILKNSSELEETLAKYGLSNDHK